jgi:hypothetical protein
MAEIARTLHCPPSYPIMYFGFRLHTNTSIDPNNTRLFYLYFYQFYFILCFIFYILHLIPILFLFYPYFIPILSLFYPYFISILFYILFYFSISFCVKSLPKLMQVLFLFLFLFHFHFIFIFIFILF